MRNYFIALCLLLLAGCTKADVESVSQQSVNSPKFHAEFAEDNTRTFVDEKVRLLWTEGDLLTIFTSTLNRKYQFDGETGDNSGTFSEIATSQFGTGNSISANYAVYPYSSSNKISNDEVITLSLPATQQYAEGSFGQDANTMVAVTSGPNDYFLPFKNVGGFLRLRLYGEGVTIKCIELKGNNSEKIAGKATVTAKYGQNPELEMSNSATESITLDCGDGVALGATAAEAKDFWIVVPPTTFTKGFTITITDTAGATMEKSTTKNYVIERNVLKSMTAFEVEIINANTPPNNQIWYTTSDGQVLQPYDSSVFGVNNIISNVYENGKGVITFERDITRIGKQAFYGKRELKEIHIPSSVTLIENSAFSSTGLTSINLPEGVTSIGEYAFYACSSLTNINIPDGVTSIGVNTFFGCASLTSINIPESITSIGKYAFRACSSLTGVNIQNGVTSIGESAFAKCTSLTSINIPESVTSMGESAFAYCTSLTSVNIQNGVTSIEYLAFENCSSLTSINIPESVTSIGDFSFANCPSLTNITIPSNLTSIGKSAFRWCKSFTSITIPESVTSIGGNAFDGCKSLTSVYCKPNTPPVLGNQAFVYNDNPERKFYVPSAAVDAYKAKWGDYADEIVGYDFSNE